MADRGAKPPESTRFKPGQSGNPGGRPKSLLTRDKVKGVMGQFADMSRDELEAVVENPKSTMLQISVAAIFVKAAKDGDYNRLSFLLDRTVGKVLEEHRHQVDLHGMRDEDLLAAAKEAMAYLGGEEATTPTPKEKPASKPSPKSKKTKKKGRS